MVDDDTSDFSPFTVSLAPGKKRSKGELSYTPISCNKFGWGYLGFYLKFIVSALIAGFAVSMFLYLYVIWSFSIYSIVNLYIYMYLYVYMHKSVYIYIYMIYLYGNYNLCYKESWYIALKQSLICLHFVWFIDSTVTFLLVILMKKKKNLLLQLFLLMCWST